MPDRIYFPISPSDGVITQVFGPTSEALDRYWSNGWDIGAKVGTPVYAPVDGIVKIARDDGQGWGTRVVIVDKYGFEWSFGHLGNVRVNEGQKVKAGQRVAEIGTGGISTGAHLSLDITANINGTPVQVDPGFFFGQYTLGGDATKHPLVGKTVRDALGNYARGFARSGDIKTLVLEFDDWRESGEWKKFGSAAYAFVPQDFAMGWKAGTNRGQPIPTLDPETFEVRYPNVSSDAGTPGGGGLGSGDELRQSFGETMAEIDAAVQLALQNMPKREDFQTAEEYQLALSSWAAGVSVLTQMRQQVMDAGFVYIGDVPVPIWDYWKDDPEMLQELRFWYDAARTKVMQGLEQAGFSLESEAWKNQFEASKERFRQLYDQFTAKLNVSQLNLNYANADIDRYFSAVDRALKEADFIAEQADKIRQWGVPMGKTSFTGAELFPALVPWMQKFRINPNAPLVQYQGTVPFDPEQILAEARARFGVSGPPPVIPPNPVSMADVPSPAYIPPPPAAPALSTFTPPTQSPQRNWQRPAHTLPDGTPLEWEYPLI